MSWNNARKRFQRNLDRYPKALRAVYEAKQKEYTLPTFEPTIFPIPKNERKYKLEDIGFTSGDLAYITEGEHKGLVSTIFQYSSELDAVLLSDVNSKRIMPKVNWVENQTTHLMDFPDYVPRSHIKLAAKDKDENGNVYYVVANSVVYKDRYYDDRYKKWLPKRFVKHHESIEVPWPSPPQDPKDGSLSTKAEDVFEKSYELQSIAKLPVPKDALSQLRNPYSKHKSKILTDSQARRINAPDMPLSDEQKIYLAKEAQRPTKTYQRLSEEVQDYIGNRISQHLAKIDNPALLAHLDALSKTTIPDFANTMKKIETLEAKKSDPEM